MQDALMDSEWSVGVYFMGLYPTDSLFISGHDIEPWPGDIMPLENTDSSSFWNPADQQMQKLWSG